MKSSHHPFQAFSLVEVTLALGIMAFCIVAVFGLLPTGFNSNQAAIQQTAAAGFAAGIAADLRQTPAETTAVPDQPSPRFLLTVPGEATLASAAATGVIHTLFLTEDGAVAASNTTTSAQDQPADPGQNPRYRATLVFTRLNGNAAAASATDRVATTVRLLVTWPALADPTGRVLPQHAGGSFETIIALDRN